MTESLIVTLVAAAVSGLTLVAYKHPKGYARIFAVVLPSVLMLGIFVLAGQLGGLDAMINSAYNDLQKYPEAPFKDHGFAIREMHAVRSFLRTFLAYYIPGIGYLVFLRFLPEVLGVARRDKNA